MKLKERMNIPKHYSIPDQGGALQVDPGLEAVDPTLAFRHFQVLKLKHEKPLSKFAFKCKPAPLHREETKHLRRYPFKSQEGQGGAVQVDLALTPD